MLLDCTQKRRTLSGDERKGSHIFGIAAGPSSQENNNYSALTSQSAFATGLGESDLNTSSNFWNSIMSGDPSKIATALAPQISGAQKRASQAKKQTAEFGTRSGGSTATMAGIDAGTRSDIFNLIGSLTDSAASNLGNMGSSLFSAGMSGTETAFNEADTMQQQNMAKWNDIFKSIGNVATGVVGGIGNLDATGSSSFGEQVGNFFGGIQ